MFNLAEPFLIWNEKDNTVEAIPEKVYFERIGRYPITFRLVTAKGVTADYTTWIEVFCEEEDIIYREPEFANLWVTDCNQFGEVYIESDYPLVRHENYTNTTEKSPEVLEIWLTSL